MESLPGYDEWLTTQPEYKVECTMCGWKFYDEELVDVNVDCDSICRECYAYREELV